MSDPLISIDVDERKRLGQFFTGEPLARVLAALAEAPSAGSVIDPMAGSGDMLVAANAMGAAAARVTAVEIDPAASELCANRLEALRGAVNVRTGDAFQPSTWLSDCGNSWDLVITNPPYVRYQRTSAAAVGRVAIPSATQVRQGLLDILDQRVALAADELDVFRTLADGYSGLADLAVPSWLLCASLVAPGGRLAMVVPDTWLSRNYALPVLYLLRKFFSIEFVVEDGEAGWFEDALVRTTLVVARRVDMRPWTDAIEPRPYIRARLTSAAADSRSLVGALHPGTIRPEWDFAECLQRVAKTGSAIRTTGLQAELSDDSALRDRLVAQASATRWGQTLEPSLQPAATDQQRFEMPRLLRAVVDVDSERLCTLGDLGWNVGQGLRTGANRFFYGEVQEAGDTSSMVQFDHELGPKPMEVPNGLLRIAVRKQSDLLASGGASGRSPGCLLLLDRYALEEDIARTEAAGVHAPFEPIPASLADFVRRAARLNVGSSAAPRRIPELSAVVTNIRRADAARPERPPRFWYQLPPLAARHVGQVFIPRVNHRHPTLTINPRGVVIDANFSTLWPRATALSTTALLALLSSTWSRVAMECCGTVLGGGALKLEATQLRRLPMPAIEPTVADELALLGGELEAAPNSTEVLTAINSVVGGAIGAPGRARQAMNTLCADLIGARSPRRVRAR